MMTKCLIKQATRKLQLAVLTKVFYLSYATLRLMNDVVPLQTYHLSDLWALVSIYVIPCQKVNNNIHSTINRY
jgi:hypothetical protein